MQTVENESYPDPLNTYEEYFQSVKEKLPESFSQLHNEIFLHDGNLKEILYSTNQNELQLKIDTDDGKGNLRQVELSYIGVILFQSKADQENGLHGPLAVVLKITNI